MWRKRAADYLVYLVVRTLICLAQALRVETGAAVARWLAWLLGDVLKIRRGVLEDNLRNAFPQWADAQRQAVMRQMWEHLFLLVLEVAHSPRKIHETNWRDFVSLSNVAPLVRRLLDDRPTLLVTAHFGNFEVAGYMLGLLGFPTFTVARTLDNPYLDQFVNSFRGKTGQYIIPKNGAFDEILAVLNRGGVLTLLADQYAGEKGCWVEFFGRPASAHKAIALLALENDAPIVVAGARRTAGPLRLEMTVTAETDPRANGEDLGTIAQLTQWYTSNIEAMIRVSPGQYWWIHRRWKDTRRPRKKAAA